MKYKTCLLIEYCYMIIILSCILLGITLLIKEGVTYAIS
jgi:hypothetical protein